MFTNKNILQPGLSPFFIYFCWLFVFCAPAKGQQVSLESPNGFLVGCNYWSSQAGTHMWRNWQPDVVDKDFAQLQENGIKVIRVFPLWPDFQPIKHIYAGEGNKKYTAFADDMPLPATGAGSNGMSEEQLQHFAVLTNLAEKHHLKLIVGLITGWMSGELYVPPALEGRNILSDPESLVWQQKFVTTFVARFKNSPAILAWDFGNECNVMEKLQDHYQAYTWSALISGAIRSQDSSRPIISGMHSLTPSLNGVWRIQDQAANTDILTTHPYSLWSNYTSQDGINTLRTVLHAAAETRMYGDIGGKPALTEETGVMGPMTGGEKEKVTFARTALFSNWAYNCQGTLWWCAYDQDRLNFPPYIYSSVEVELGLSKSDRTPKPVLTQFKAFSNFLDNFPYQRLPEHQTEAICLLTENQDSWAAAYSSFILAKQAGFDFKFQKAGQPLEDASLYLLPSLKGIDPVFKPDWNKLLEKVQNGATLYMSLDDAYLPSFNDPLGIELSINIKRRGHIKFSSKLFGRSLQFDAPSERKLVINPKASEVLGREPDGNPCFIRAKYGEGQIYLLTFPLETNLATTTGAFDYSQPRYADIYRYIAASIPSQRILKQDNPYVGETEHPLNDHEKIIVLINYGTDDTKITPKIREGWKINHWYYGKKASEDSLTLPANDAIVLSVSR